MQHRILSTLLSVAVLIAAGGGMLAWLSREQEAGRATRQRRRLADNTVPDDEDMERLLEKFAAALPKDEAEWMLRRGREQLETRH